MTSRRVAQLVEPTAHNGLDVDSSPAAPSIHRPWDQDRKRLSALVTIARLNLEKANRSQQRLSREISRQYGAPNDHDIGWMIFEALNMPQDGAPKFTIEVLEQMLAEENLTYRKNEEMCRTGVRSAVDL